MQVNIPLSITEADEDVKSFISVVTYQYLQLNSVLFIVFVTQIIDSPLISCVGVLLLLMNFNFSQQQTKSTIYGLASTVTVYDEVT